MATETAITAGAAGRYASALHALASEAGSASKIGVDLNKFQALLNESADLKALALSPAVSSADQIRALNVLLPKAGIAGLSANFIKLVAQKRRLANISDMVVCYNRLEDAANGVARAEAVAAQPLSGDQMKLLQRQLAAAAGTPSVEVAVKVDPALIGGLIVKMGSVMVDDSVKTKLNSIRTRMKEVG